MPAAELLYEAVKLDQQECIEWPLAKNEFGYGTVWYEGSPRLAHRVVCRLAHGEPATPDLEAAHSCRNRACINWRHLRWATRLENNQDRVKHGTARTVWGEKHGAAKLTEAQAKEILAKAIAGERQTAIARQYRVSKQTVSAIKTGTSWGHLPRGAIVPGGSVVVRLSPIGETA